MPIAHVETVNCGDPSLDALRLEAATQVLACRGFTVVPIPDDGRHHPVRQACPVCRNQLASV